MFNPCTLDTRGRGYTGNKGEKGRSITRLTVMFNPCTLDTGGRGEEHQKMDCYV